MTQSSASRLWRWAAPSVNQTARYTAAEPPKTVLATQRSVWRHTQHETVSMEVFERSVSWMKATRTVQWCSRNVSSDVRSAVFTASTVTSWMWRRVVCYIWISILILMYCWPCIVIYCDISVQYRCQTLLEDLWTIWSCCLYVFYDYHSHIPSCWHVYVLPLVWIF